MLRFAGSDKAALRYLLSPPVGVVFQGPRLECATRLFRPVSG